MNILVCVKQVPDTAEIKINPETNTLIRDGVPSIVNPFDGYALEAAARIKDKDPDTKIVVVSMGPEQAKNALKECLAIAADKAYLVSDRVFGGSDTLATSYISPTPSRRSRSWRQVRRHLLRQAGHRRRHRPGGPGDRRAPGLSQVTYGWRPRWMGIP